MNIKKIIQEEVNDFDWIKNIDYKDVLDNHFGIKTEGDESWFRDYPSRKNIHPSYEMYNRLVYNTGSGLYKIVYGEKLWKWSGLFKRLRIGNKLDNWRIDRLERLKKYYPDMYEEQLNNVTYG